MPSITPYLRLMRPANIITAIADIMAGFAASGSVMQAVDSSFWLPVLLNIETLGWLVISTIGLYGGGVVFNDVFDAELDRVERPERPIPSGLVSKTSAAIVGGILLLIGVVAAYQVSVLSAIIALVIALLALLYDAIGKHHSFFGPINMGACRSGNLLLGVSAVPASIDGIWFIALIPLVYIAAITMISRGEVHGGDKRVMNGAVALYSLVVFSLIALAWLPQYNGYYIVPILVLFLYLVFPPVFKAIREPQPQNVMKAVKAGVLSLIVLDATLAAGFAGWAYGVVILALLPLSRFIAKQFAVT